MVTRRFMATSIVCVLACAVLAAADFWEEKEFTAWSDRDVEKMMTDSPWAKRLTVRFPRPPRESSGRGRGGFGAAAGFGGGSPQSRLIVQWRSGLPIRQAMVRGRIGEGGTVDPNGRQILAQPPPAYFVVVTGVPGQFARLAPQALMAETRLERGEKPPIAAAQAGPQREGQGFAFVYAFPRTDPITLDDEEVEFVTQIGEVTIKRKFELEDMVVNGQLEL